MKTVAFVLKGYPRVSETFIAQEIHLLEQRGFRIEILSMRDAREPERQPVVGRIRAPVLYLPEYVRAALGRVALGNLRAAMRAPARYLFWGLAALGRTVARRDKSPLKRFLQAGWVAGRRRFGRGPGAIGHLHAHFVHAPTELTLALSRLTGVPFSISAHAKDLYTIPARDVVERVNRARLLMTCTEANCTFLRSLPGLESSRVHRVYHGIDLETFRRRLPLPSGTAFAAGLSRFVSVGRLVEKKGYDVVLEALARLRGRGIEFTYDIYGSGEGEAGLRALVARLGLAGRVRFHGTATHPEILRRLEEGGIYLGGYRVTANGDRDGIPNTVAEAMAMELPVLATRVSGVPELLEHGRSGHLVEPGDPVAFAEALESMLSRPDYCRQLALEARCRVARVFDCQCCIESCADLLAPLVKSEEGKP